MVKIFRYSVKERRLLTPYTNENHHTQITEEPSHEK